MPAMTWKPSRSIAPMGAVGRKTLGDSRVWKKSEFGAVPY
jgi:hypothetical protein